MKIIYIKIVFQEQLKFLNKVFSPKMLFKEIQKKKRQIILKLNLFIDIQNNDSDKETNFHSSVKQDKKELT